MTGRERLIIGTRWMLENVKQESINMGFWRCGTSGCWLGWLGACPALRAEGLEININDLSDDFKVNGEKVGLRGVMRFFNLKHSDYLDLFSSNLSGKKADILQRLHTVLQQPGPYEEPEISNLDQEWADLQRALEQSHDQTASLY